VKCVRLDILHLLHTFHSDHTQSKKCDIPGDFPVTKLRPWQLGFEKFKFIFIMLVYMASRGVPQVMLRSEIKPSKLQIGKNYIIVNHYNKPFKSTNRSPREVSRDTENGKGIGYRFLGLDEGKATFKRIGTLDGRDSSISGKTSVSTDNYYFYQVNDAKFRKRVKYNPSSSATDPLPIPLPPEERAKSRRSSSSERAERAKSRRSSSSERAKSRRSSSLPKKTRSSSSVEYVSSGIKPGSESY